MEKEKEKEQEKEKEKEEEQHVFFAHHLTTVLMWHVSSKCACVGGGWCRCNTTYAV